MDFFNRMVEQFIRANRRLKRWQRAVSVMAAVVVFATTYALVLPAITLDKETASAQAGIEIAASDNDADGDGTVYEAEPEEEPAEEPQQEESEEPQEDSGEPQDAGLLIEESGSESGSRNVEDSEEDDAGEEPEAAFGQNTEEQADSEEAEAPSDNEDIAPGAVEDEAVTASTAETPAESEAAEEIKLITEETQLIYEYVDEYYADGIEDENDDGIDDGYFVYAEFGADAKLPEGVELKAEEITKESDPEAYEGYYEKALSGLQDKYDEKTALSFARFYDIKFVYNGTEIEPSGDVKVRIEYKKAVEIEKETTVDAVHFDKNKDEEPEVIDSEVNKSEVEMEKEDRDDTVKTVEFESDQFSVYGIVCSYTVDFHWEVNGKTFEFSIPGGGFISLEHLVEALGIADAGENSADAAHPEAGNGSGNDSEDADKGQEVPGTFEEAVEVNNDPVSEAAKEFVANVERVEFSSPELVWAGRAESGTTVGEIKEEHGLDVQYSVELPEELIAEMDSHELAAGDWVLVSLLPFDTVETLTVTMTNGEVWEIAVTDVNANARKGSLISASGIMNNQNVVIYQKVVQPDDSILYYAIDGNGNLQRVYNSSDSVYWLNDPPIVWKVTALSDGAGTGTGYYTLYNEATGNYLVPKDDNGTYKVVHKLSDFPDGDAKHVQVSLPGKDSGQYLSKIASWDYAANVTYGMEVLSATDLHAKELLSSQEFLFATPDEIVQGRLTTVDTVDSLSKGIKITMFDFTGNEWQKDPEPRLSYMTRIIGDSSYAEGVYHPGLVRPILGSDGFPVSTATGQSIRPVFQTQGNYYSNSSNSWNTPGTFNYSVNRTDNVNHLFLQSVYDATGYFSYSCFENYARLNGSNFEVYEQLGTPWDGNEFFFQRGNFMPYNTLDLIHIKSNTTGSSSSSPLGDDDPRKGEDLYVINGNADYYFGMIMEADFIQGLNGYNDRDEPTVYEFNGDDDLWIYIDNVLVLDIGGVHDAFQGRIDFATGAVTITNGTNTTIKQMFRNADVFPDGTPWNESRVNEYFEGNTFKDYSTHSFKMFYMERGAAASNLEMKFNLMPVQGSSFRVTKQVPETATGDVVQNDYADAVFYYRAYIGNNICTQSAFGSTAKYADGSPVIWKDNNTFQLKHGQTAIFPVESNTVRYYVEEVEPETGSTMLDHYYVTNSDPEPGQQAGKETVSAEKSVKQRGEVVFANKPDDSIVNELRIVKNLTGDMYTDDQGNLLVNEETGSPYFEYRIYLENTAGKMVYYSLGEYYQIDINGKYVYYERGERKTAEYRNGKYIYTYRDGTVEELDKPKITEHTSQNGTIGDIRHGDTIIIRGLLEGTDFAVDERTDRSLMIKGTPGEDTTEKYSFDGTEVEDAYIRATGENTPTYPTGTLYDPPALPDAAYSNKAAEGTIIQEKDAKVTVKNSSNLINADLSLNKVSENSAPLEGAVFKLMRDQEIIPVALSGEGVVIEPLVAGETVTINANTFKVPEGGIKIKNIPASKTGYKLVEVSAPDGYLNLHPEVAAFKVWAGDIEMTDCAEIAEGLTVTFNGGSNTFTVPNPAGPELPSTGGPGTNLIYILGIMLTGLAGAGLVMKRRRRNTV